MIFEKKQQETRERTMIEARAKINLTLDVTGKREDGYHLVKMVMQSVDLHDDVRVTIVCGEKKSRGIVLSVQHAVPADRQQQPRLPRG